MKGDVTQARTLCLSHVPEHPQRSRSGKHRLHRAPAGSTTRGGPGLGLFQLQRENHRLLLLIHTVLQK